MSETIRLLQREYLQLVKMRHQQESRMAEILEEIKTLERAS